MPFVRVDPMQSIKCRWSIWNSFRESMWTSTRWLKSSRKSALRDNWEEQSLLQPVAVQMSRHCAIRDTDGHRDTDSQCSSKCSVSPNTFICRFVDSSSIPSSTSDTKSSTSSSSIVSKWSNWPQSFAAAFDLNIFEISNYEHEPRFRSLQAMIPMKDWVEMKE